MKKFLSIAGITVAMLFAALLIAGIILYSKKSVRFLLAMTDMVKPKDFTVEETTIRIGTEDIPMMIYRPGGKKVDKYYFMLHGLTPESYRHPIMLQTAGALCHATGRTLFLPHIRGSVEWGRPLTVIAKEIADIYLALRKTYPGEYNAFGACIAATGLLVVFNTIPVEQYPDKMFLYGPFFTGPDLVEFYNSAGVELDYIVRMTNALYSDKFKEEEKKVISRAIFASKPGTTDRAEMSKILGEELYRRIDTEKIYNPQVALLGKSAILSKGRKIPHTTVYIIHSRGDNIVPFTAGLSLHNFLLQCGVKSKFVGTGIFMHTQKKKSLKKIAIEVRDLIEFLDDLFAENE
ncbi:MAG: hypothetical protein JW807_14005 [Spirochaetes bacterium]|nr:hypothetical protein [Spirochaetota bacterium]